jgi:hypothetical protein
VVREGFEEAILRISPCHWPRFSRVVPEEQHNVQSRRNSSVSYHVNTAPCVICDEGIPSIAKLSSFTPKLQLVQLGRPIPQKPRCNDSGCNDIGPYYDAIRRYVKVSGRALTKI